MDGRRFDQGARRLGTQQRQRLADQRHAAVYVSGLGQHGRYGLACRCQSTLQCALGGRCAHSQGVGSPMTNGGQESRPKPLPGSVLGLAAALAIAGAVAFAASKPAGALQAYTEKTVLSCGGCHTSAAGGGALTAFGKEYVANGHKVPKKEKTAGKKTVA